MNKKKSKNKLTKNPEGRPPFYKTPKEMQSKIDEYFKSGFRKKLMVVGNRREGYKQVEVPMITITDLVIFLGFADRHSFYAYEKIEKFSHTIKRARTFIEREYEEMLNINPTGAIFALKNFGWTDKMEVENTGGITINIRETIDESKQ